MIKDLLKRRIALFLALFMLIGLVPFGTLAESIGRSEPTRAKVNTGGNGEAVHSRSYWTTKANDIEGFRQGAYTFDEHCLITNPLTV